MVVGTVTLTAPKLFTQYGEHAAWTDYVQCEPQTVELRFEGGYWLCARFVGVLESTSYPNRHVGTPATAHTQWSYAGFNPDTLRAAGFDVVLTRGRTEVVGTYGHGTTNPGSNIVFYRAS